MVDNAIIIRPAGISDIESIWELLHADSQMWSDETITARLTQLYVLTYQNKLIAALYGNITTKKSNYSRL